MADMKPINPINVDERLRDLSLYRHHPNGLVDDSMNILSDILDGRAGILDPSNPPAYVIETSCMNTAYAVSEFVLAIRKRYGVLANNEEDLYLHMSDREYEGRFGAPAVAKITFNLRYNDFLTKAYIDQATGDTILTIPRYTNFEIDDMVFTLMSSIVITRTAKGVVEVRYRNELTDDLFPVSEGYLDYDVWKEGHDERYLTFEAELPEIKVSRKNVQVEKSGFLTGTINYTEGRQFYYVKAFHSFDGQTWHEMITTHTEDVYDIYSPTCVIKVLQDSHMFSWYVPPGYIANGQIGSVIRFVYYTTKGPINYDFSQVEPAKFTGGLSGIFPEIEEDKTSAAIKTLMPEVFIDGRIIGGSQRKSFERLKFDYINNNLRKTIPITPIQSEHRLLDDGLTPVRNYDVVSGREYLVKTEIPSDVSKYRVARMSLDMIEYMTSLESLKSGKDGVTIINRDVIVLNEGTIFQAVKSDGLRILTLQESKRLRAMSGQALANEVNNNTYLSLYYHYVLDVSGVTTSLRAYDLSKPEVKRVLFKNYNNTLRISANSAVKLSKIERSTTGYRLDFLTKVKIFDQSYSADNIIPVLVYMAPNGGRYFIEGKLAIDVKENPIFTAYIETSGHITEDNRIYVHNFKDVNGDKITIDIDLTQKLELFYLTNSFPSTWEPTEMDEVFKGTYMSGHIAAITHETHTIEFGLRLRRLYTKVHSTTGVNEYRRHEKDVYHQYQKTVYGKDNKVLHNKGEFILDEKGNKIVQFEAGSVVLDIKGEPVVAEEKGLAKFLNLLLMDYKVLLADGVITNSYKDHVRKTINSVVLKNMEALQKQYYDQTEVFATVPNGLTDITAKYSNKHGYMRSSQAFKFYIHVTPRVHADMETRKSIEHTIRETLDRYLIGNRYLSRIELMEAIFKRIKNYVLSIRIDKFTELDSEYIRIDSDNAEITIRKRLKVTPTGYDVIDDVAFYFIKEE